MKREFKERTKKVNPQKGSPVEKCILGLIRPATCRVLHFNATKTARSIFGSRNVWTKRESMISELFYGLTRFFRQALRSGIEPEHAQLLAAAAGLRDARGPCDSLFARG